MDAMTGIDAEMEEASAEPATRPAEAPGPLAGAEGLITGIVTGSLLWLAMVSFVFTLLRSGRLY
jgi:hypothetical protein